ncbi:MAG: hypothetical protein ACREF8_06035 [Chthoniobacterales bacterium]
MIAMRSVSKFLYAFNAIFLAAGAVVHAASFPKAFSVLDASKMSAFFAGAFKGLWLGDSVSLFFLALIFGLVAVSPISARRPLILVLALMLLALAGSIYATMGSFFAGHILLLSGISTLVACGLHPRMPVSATGHEAGQ